MRATVFMVVSVSLYCLHSLRGLSILFAVVPMLVSMGFALVEVSFFKPIRMEKFAIFSVAIFLVFSFFPIFTSYLSYGHEDYIYSFFRYFYLVPFFLLAILCVRSETVLIGVLKTYVFFILLAAFSIFYQYFNGPISWFPEASVREGLVRFSSLVGSLTAYGVYFIFALPVLIFLFKNGLLKFAILFFIVLGALLSLQKAAVVNLLLLFMMLFFFERGRFRLWVVLSALLLGVLLALAYFFELTYVVSTVDNVLRIGEGAGSSDVSIVEGVLDRLWALPSVLYERHGELGLLLGVGMVGGSGTLGFPEYPMSHNGFFDLLFVGGVGSFVAFLMLFSYCFVRVWTAKKNADVEHNVSKVSMYILLLFLFNFAFAGILYLQPYGGVIFYSVLVFFCFGSTRSLHGGQTTVDELHLKPVISSLPCNDTSHPASDFGFSRK